MSKRPLEPLTEAMFYVLMAFGGGEKCGVEASEFIKGRTEGRVSIGPGTLYAILAAFEENGLIKETSIEGRKRTYAITDYGRTAYAKERLRLKSCTNDAEKEEALWREKFCG